MKKEYEKIENEVREQPKKEQELKEIVKLAKDYKRIYDNNIGFCGVSMRFEKPAVNILVSEWSNVTGSMDYTLDAEDPDYKFVYREIDGVIFFALVDDESEVE